MQKNNTVQAIWIGLGSLSSFALAIVSAAILSRYFDKEEYGTYRQILYVYNTLLVIFSAGLPGVFGYFLPRFNLAQGKDIVWKITKVLLIAGAAFSLFLFVFSGLIADILKNPELSTGLKYFSPIPLLLLPTLGIEGIFSTYQKSIYIAIYNVTTRILMLLFIVLPVIIFKGSYLYAIYGWIIVSIISLLIAFYFKNIPFKKVKEEKSGLRIRDVFAYSLPLVGASIAGIAIRSSDQFFISRFFGVEVFAEFSNGFIDLPFVSMVTNATSIILMPLLSKMIFNKDSINNIVSLWKNALLKSAYIIYPVVIFFLFFAGDTIVLLYSEAYEKSIIYFQIAMLLNFFNIITFAPLLLSSGNTRFYGNMHVIFAIIAWVGGFIIVYTFNNPVAIAVFSVSMSIARVFIGMKKVSKIFNLTLLELLPLKKITLIITHSLTILFFTKLFSFYSQVQTNVFVNLLVSGVIYMTLLLTTSKIFKLDYLIIIKNIFLKKNNHHV